MNWDKQRKSTIWWTILATVLFLLFSFSFWFYREFYNKANFEKHVSSALQTEQSKQALASIIIDQGFKDKPVIRNFLSEQAEPALAGMLGAPRVQTVFNKFISQSYESLFSSHPRAIAINISNIKTFVERLTTLIETVSGKDVQNITIPDAIVIVGAGVIPSILSFATTLLTVGPIALIISIALAIWLLIRSVNKPAFIKIVGICLATGSFITILLVSWYQVILLGKFENSDARDIAEQIVREFSSTFIHQNTMLLFAGIVFFAGGLLYDRFMPPHTSKSSTKKND